MDVEAGEASVAVVHQEVAVAVLQGEALAVVVVAVSVAVEAVVALVVAATLVLAVSHGAAVAAGVGVASAVGDGVNFAWEEILATCSAVQLFSHVTYPNVARLGRFSAFRKKGKGCLVYLDDLFKKKWVLYASTSLGNRLKSYQDQSHWGDNPCLGTS